MARALFLIDTPSQVFNILEAIREYQLSDYDLMINDCNRADTYAQLKARISVLTPTHLIEVPRMTGDIAGRIEVYARHLVFLQSRQYSHVFFSAIRQQWQRDIVCSVDAQKHILLDDGNATVIFYDCLFHQQKFFDFPEDPDPERSLRSAEVRAQWQIKTSGLSKLELFTIFDLSPMPWLTVRRNLLTTMHKNHQHLDTELVYLLGVGAVTVNYITEQSYLQLLAQTKDLFPEKRLCYIPHRIESDGLLTAISKLGFSVQRLDMPVENWLFQSDVAPYAVLSYHSTALFTCAAMFPAIRVISIQPSIEVWHDAASSHIWNFTACNNQEGLATVYKYLKKDKNVECIDLG